MKTLKYFSSFTSVIKKSRFIGFAYPIIDELDAKQKIKDIQNKYSDARHVVYAYKIGNDIVRKENSSEPAGTAGLPILSVIENNELTNTLIIVVRYFGGVLLGASNLYRAYSDTAQGTIIKNEIIDIQNYAKYKVKISYIDYATLNSLASKDGEVKIFDCDFGVSIVVNLAILKTTKNSFLIGLMQNNISIGDVWL